MSDILKYTDTGLHLITANNWKKKIHCWHLCFLLVNNFILINKPVKFKIALLGKSKFHWRAADTILTVSSVENILNILKFTGSFSLFLSRFFLDRETTFQAHKLSIEYLGFSVSFVTLLWTLSHKHYTERFNSWRHLFTIIKHISSWIFPLLLCSTVSLLQHMHVVPSPNSNQR